MSLTRKQRDSKHTKRKRQTKRSSSGFTGHPGDDFYEYINHSWLQKAEIPPTKTAFGVSEEVENKIDEQTKELLKSCIAKAKSKQKEVSYEDRLEHLLGIIYV